MSTIFAISSPAAASQAKSASEKSGSAQLAFLHGPFVGFLNALDTIAELAVGGWKLPDDFVHSGRREPLGQAGNELNPFANPKLMMGHLGAPRSAPKIEQYPSTPLLRMR